MYERKKIRKVFTSKFVGTGPSSYKKRIYRATVSQRLRNPVLHGYKIFGSIYCLHHQGRSDPYTDLCTLLILY